MIHCNCLLVIITLCLLIEVTHGFSQSSTINSNIRYRNGQKRDEIMIASTMAKELMNPLGIQGNRFVVAVDDSSNKDSVIGWAQIKPLGKPMMRDPSKFNAPPGSYDVEQDVDDAMWDDFENDENIKVPTGLASLPWTKEYREMSQAVQDRDRKRQQLRAQREQELDLIQLWELSSVYVEPAYRGKGIGTELVRRVLRRRLTEDEKPSLPSSIYCLTLATTVAWYQDNFGFETVADKDIPAPMALEVTAGSLITKLIGAQLCCMRATEKTMELCQQVGMTS